MTDTRDDTPELADTLSRIDGRGYKSYREIERSWWLPGFTLIVDRVQSDPFATPSRLRAVIDPDTAGLPPDAYRSAARLEGTAAHLARNFAAAARSRSRSRGTGRSGEIRMEDPGQLVLRQTAILVSAGGAIEARFTVGLPARGRRIDGKQARALLLEEVPTLVRETLFERAHDAGRIEEDAAANEDAEALRAALREAGLIAFVADGASLPRRGGDDDRPLDGQSAVPFTSPDSMRVRLTTPNAGRLSGLGIAEGITLIVGGGFHGKSTLLRAIQSGVYNHAPGDGRERVVTRRDAVKVRAEDGRSVAGVDIFVFIDGLPLDRDTRAFSTSIASGSTSQAAAIMEAVESGAGALLIDEDTSASNFMVRDRRMQELVSKEGEPITPFVDRARALYDEAGVSTVLVAGGSGDYLDIADHVIRMRDYRAEDVTEEAHAVAKALPTGRRNEATTRLVVPPPRRVVRASVNTRRGKRSTYVRVPDERTLLLGENSIDLVAIEQIESRAQSRTIGLALAWLIRQHDDDVDAVPDTSPPGLSVDILLDRAEEALAEAGPGIFADSPRGDLAAFRRFELGATLNRLRGLRVV